MRLLLFTVVAICIAGSRTQEIAIGTEYLRAHFNGSLSSESANYAQDLVVPPVAVVAVESASTAETTTTTTTVASKVDEAKNDDDQNKKFDHEHKSHHEHDATITVDLHNILDLFKQLLEQTEERITAAIQHNQPASPVVKSYRTADR